MKKPLKIILALVAVLVLLIVGAVAAITMLVDLNDYKPQLAELAEKYTGHKVEFNGPLELKVFPKLAANIKKVTVLSDPAFGVPTIMELDEASLSMSLLPLLSKRLEVDSVLLSGAKISLVTAKNGRNNWDMPRGKSSVSASPDAGAGAPDAGADTSKDAGKSGSVSKSVSVSGEIDSIRIEKCLLNYKDLRSGQDVSLQLNELDLKDLALGKDMALILDAVLNDKASASTFAARLDGRLRSDPNKKHVVLDFPKLGFTVKTQTIQEPQSFDGSLKGDVLLSGFSGNLALSLKNKNLELKLAAKSDGYKNGLNSMNGGLPSMSGELALKSNPSGLLGALGTELGMADAKAMSAFNLEALFTIGATRANELVISALKGNLDDTTINGQLAASLPGASGLPSGIDYKADLSLELGAIDLNRYLPKESGAKAASTEPAATGSQTSTATADATAAQAPKQGPLKGTALEKALLDVDIKLESAAIKKAVITDVELKAAAHRGIVELKALNAKSFDGALKARGRADLLQPKPPVSLVAEVGKFDLGMAMQQLLENDKLSGKADLNADLRFNGLEWVYADGSGISRTINGNVKVAVDGGKIQNFQLIPADAPATLLSHRQNDYPFDTLGGNFKFDNGVIRNNDLAVRSPRLNVDGEGSVNLWSNHIDYRLVVAIPSSNPEKPDKLTVPLRATGDLDNFKYGPDLEAVGKGAAKDIVEKLREDGKLPAKDSEEAKKLEEKAQGVKNLLNSLKKK